MENILLSQNSQKEIFPENLISKLSEMNSEKRIEFIKSLPKPQVANILNNWFQSDNTNENNFQNSAFDSGKTYEDSLYFIMNMKKEELKKFLDNLKPDRKKELIKIFSETLDNYFK